MKKLLSIEIQESLVTNISEFKGLGTVVHIRDNIHLFINNNKIGLFNKDEIDKVNGDFSKIPIIELLLCQESTSTISPYDSSYVH